MRELQTEDTTNISLYMLDISLELLCMYISSHEVCIQITLLAKGMHITILVKCGDRCGQMKATRLRIIMISPGM